MKLVEAIAKRTKDLLSEKGYSMYGQQMKGGVPRSTLSDVTSIKKKRVSTDTVYQLCVTIGITLKDFFDDPIFNEVTD